MTRQRGCVTLHRSCSGARWHNLCSHCGSIMVIGKAGGDLRSAQLIIEAMTEVLTEDRATSWRSREAAAPASPGLPFTSRAPGCPAPTRARSVARLAVSTTKPPGGKSPIATNSGPLTEQPPNSDPPPPQADPVRSYRGAGAGGEAIATRVGVVFPWQAPRWRCKPGAFVAGALGRGGRGSLASKLKARKLAASCQVCVCVGIARHLYESAKQLAESY